jgi:hypothetical protein
MELADHRRTIPDRWWEKAAAMKLVTLKRGERYSYAHPISIEPVQASRQLDDVRAQGFDSIEIFAPAHGRFAYNGLDTVDHYAIDPEVGTMDDFRRFVRLAHERAIAVVAFVNVGYLSLEAPDFAEACAEKDKAKASWFWWADSPNAPIPPEHAYFNRPRKGPDNEKTWGWQYSERAGRYFWARWRTQDAQGAWVGLPQNNWQGDSWPAQAQHIVEFWMDAGLDGLIIDAPMYYAGSSWAKNNRAITDVIVRRGNTFAQPEGADDIAWITEGRYNCLQDYGLSVAGVDVIQAAVDSGDPRPIEEALRRYHDVVVARRAVLYRRLPGRPEEAQRHLERATLVALGDLVVYGLGSGVPDAEETALLTTKRCHPALHGLSRRRKLPTAADDRHYALLKTADDGSERILAVLNYQPTAQTVEVDLSGLAFSSFVDLMTGEPHAASDRLAIRLGPYGYGFFQVLPLAG